MTQANLTKGLLIGMAVVILSDVVGKYIPTAKAV